MHMKDGHFFVRLESARGIAALTVVAMHTMVTLSPLENSDTSRTVLRLILNGQGAVNFFFVLSGFVLGAAIARTFTARASLFRFIAARFFRLYPAVIATGIIYAAVIFFIEPEGSVTAGRIIKNALLLEVSLNGVLWSLQIEVIAIPLIILLGYLEFQFGIFPLAAANVVLLTLIFANFWTNGVVSFAPMFAFALGMIIRRLSQTVSNMNTSLVALLFLVALICFELPRAVLAPSTGGYRWITILEALSSAAMIAAIAFSLERLFAFLDNSFFRFYGRISYSLYLVHSLTLICLKMIFPAANTVLECLFSIVVVILVSTMLAYLSWRFIELPGIALGRRLFWRRESTSSMRPA